MREEHLPFFLKYSLMGTFYSCALNAHAEPGNPKEEKKNKAVKEEERVVIGIMFFLATAVHFSRRAFAYVIGGGGTHTCIIYMDV